MSNKVLEQILDIRNSGEINMFDTNGVQKIANDKGFYELVIFIEEHRDEYCRFILTGEKKQLEKKRYK